jgi:hypothetical protein
MVSVTCEYTSSVKATLACPSISDRVDAAAEQEGGCSVAQVVEANPGESGFRQEVREGPAKVACVHRPPELVGEDESDRRPPEFYRPACSSGPLTRRRT